MKHLSLQKNNSMKLQTVNEYEQRVNQAIDYINAHLYTPLKLDILARRLNISSHHFHRIMKSYLNEPLATYITRQRMERAVMYMQTDELPLKELAIKVGYETPQSFSRAFSNYSGFSPAAYKKTLYNRMARPKANLATSNNLSEAIITIEPILELAYVRILGKYGESGNFADGWNKLSRFLRDNHLHTPDIRWIGLSFDDPNITRNEHCRFYACATVPAATRPDGAVGRLTIGAGKYAVYTHKGSYDGLLQFYTNLYSQMPYAPRHSLPVEEYVNSPRDTDENELITRIYIPIK